MRSAFGYARENRVFVVVKTLDRDPEGRWESVILSERPMILATILDWDWQFPNRLSKRMMGRFGLKIFVQRKWTRHLRRLAPVL